MSKQKFRKLVEQQYGLQQKIAIAENLEFLAKVDRYKQSLESKQIQMEADRAKLEAIASAS